MLVFFLFQPTRRRFNLLRAMIFNRKRRERRTATRIQLYTSFSYFHTTTTKKNRNRPSLSVLLSSPFYPLAYGGRWRSSSPAPYPYKMMRIRLNLLRSIVSRIRWKIRYWVFFLLFVPKARSKADRAVMHKIRSAIMSTYT